MYANVLIEYPIKSLDKAFTYKVPDKFINVIKVGMKVIVPFNKSVVNGIVLTINNNKPLIDVKEIYNIENPEIYLNEEQLKLGKYLQEQTLCPLITAYETMLPSALKINKSTHNYDKKVSYIIIDDINKAQKYATLHSNMTKQIYIIDKIIENKKILKKEINSSSLQTLLKKGIVKEIIEKEYRIKETKNENIIIKLNDEQQNAYNKIKDGINNFKTYLIEGVTGSGKTEVYMSLIEDVISIGKSAIVLVPEICLTTQTVKRFYNRFGENVAIFHSGLSNGEKYDEYLKIYRDEVKIVVGTRSSIFVPLKDLGIVIIDEEHSDTYKQESNPRYNAIDIALYRCKYHNIPLILASATPLLESKARAQKGVYEHIYLKKRVNNLPLPKTIIVDMKEEIKKRNMIFSEILQEKIQDRLDKNEQTILLLNRRGYSTYISCSNCGYVYKCPNCDITLTYHKSSNNLRCHYCGYFIKKDDLCPNCQSEALNYLGLGTQKVEDKLKELFPSARVVRMDQDTTSKKGSYQKIIDDFANNKYDILLGTQMISKGLDFAGVTLVGIINADTSLAVPDFRANEKTFSLLYQTSGRSGRSKKGEVILQTFNPENEVLNYVKNNDFEGFYRYEMNIRHSLLYPPYTYIVSVIIKSKDYEKVSKEANKIKKYIEDRIDKKSIIYGPTPASMFKVNNVYHFAITIKYTFDDKLKLVLKNIDELYTANTSINVEITFNPSRY